MSLVINPRFKSFDFPRERRKWDQYLKWFDVTLQLRVPMLLFITEDLQEFVDELSLIHI